MNRYWERIPLRSFCFSVALLVFLTAGREAKAAQLTLSWGDASSNEDGFKIERKTGTAGTFAQVGATAVNTTTYLNTNLSDGTSYCYRVKAYNTAGDSAYSNEACGSTSTVPFTLTVAKSGNGQGNATSSPVGIACGSDCSESYTSTATVTLSAAPAAGSTFSGWSGGGCSGTGNCTLLMNTSTNVTATFTATTTTPTTYSLTVSKTGTGSGTVSGTGINCGTDCSEAYANNTAVTLTPSAATGSTFASWSGDADCSDGAVTMNAAKTCTATFLTATVGGDTMPPTAPGGFTATVASSSQINLRWTAATDNVGVTKYLVERCKGAGCTNFTQIATPSGTYWNNTGFKSSAGLTYQYRIRARDAAGNLGPYSAIATATFGPYSPAPTTGLVAAYSFNAGSGTTVKDSSGLNNTGTLANGATWTGGKNGNAVSFDGTNDKVALPSTLDIARLPFTLEAWIRPTSFADWRAIFSKRASYSASQMRFDVGLEISSGRVYVTTNNSFVTSSYTPPLNSWTHIALVAESTGTKLYVNGKLWQTLGAITLGSGATAPVAIGNTGDQDDPFSGQIDDLRLYLRALSQAEIQTDMNTAVTP